MTEQSQGRSGATVLGAQVIKIEEDSPARRYLRVGDIITSVGSRPRVNVESVDDLVEAVKTVQTFIYESIVDKEP